MINVRFTCRSDNKTLWRLRWNITEDKNILITGAFGGFGVCFISQLLDSGADLILCDVPQSAIPIRDNKKSLPGLGAGREKQILSVISADLSTAEGCRALYDEYKKLGIGVDMIIHNAGIAFLGEYVDIPPDLNEKVINVNLFSIMRLNTLFLPELIRRKIRPPDIYVFRCRIRGYAVGHSLFDIEIRCARICYGTARRNQEAWNPNLHCVPVFFQDPYP